MKGTLMAHGNWEDVIQEYLDHPLDSRHYSHVQAMLELIPTLQESLTGSAIVPGTSHDNLVLHIPNKRLRIYIWYDAHRGYDIYLYHPIDGEIDPTTVQREEVVSAIYNLLQRAENYG